MEIFFIILLVYLLNRSKKAKRTAKGQRITLKEFIRRKKERQRKQGRIAVRPDSKYSGRKRRVKW
jgi:hypothetical protein